MPGHDHDHDHPAAAMVDEITDFEVLEIAVRELAIGPAGGSRLVAKAWTDTDFLALAHAMLDGGLVAEQDLVGQINLVRTRLQTGEIRPAGR